MKPSYEVRNIRGEVTKNFIRTDRELFHESR